MLFTITRDQYQRYKDSVGPCMDYILNRYGRLCSVVDTFNNYFGASFVDVYGAGFSEKSLLLTLLEDYESLSRLQSITDFLNSGSYDIDRLFSDLAIYVHWPAVTVTNERGQSTVVRDLYAKVPMHFNGRLAGTFTLSRATYTYEQYSSGYMHSHINGINSTPSEFMRPCLGSGPLIRTQNSLSGSRSADLWDLFCVELDRYVHVESIEGVPYRHLDQIGTNSLLRLNLDGHRSNEFRYFNQDPALSNLFKQFFKYVLVRKKLKFGFSNGIYVPSCSNVDWILKLSKLFIKFFAMMVSAGATELNLAYLMSKNMIRTVKICNNALFLAGTSTRNRNLSNYSDFNGRFVLYFKGERITTHVDDPTDHDDNSYYVLNPTLALGFLDQCLNYLNIYEHEKTENTIQDNQEESESISGASDCSARCSARNENSKNAFPDYPISEKRISVSL